MNLDPKLREWLLGTRNHNGPCEHGWMYQCQQPTDPEGCPGGAPVAVECETCDGSGNVTETDMAYGAEVNYLIPCSDCDGVGVRLLVGQLIEWCSEHNAQRIAAFCWNSPPLRGKAAANQNPCVFVTVYQVGPQ